MFHALILCLSLSFHYFLYLPLPFSIFHPFPRGAACFWCHVVVAAVSDTGKLATGVCSRGRSLGRICGAVLRLCDRASARSPGRPHLSLTVCPSACLSARFAPWPLECRLPSPTPFLPNLISRITLFSCLFRIKYCFPIQLNIYELNRIG